MRTVIGSFPQQKVKHGSATDDAVLPQSNWPCSSGEKAGESTKNQEEREEKGEIRQEFRQARGSNTIHILEAKG